MRLPRLRLRNREGDPVDPWPFVVVAGIGVLLVLSFGPLYLEAFGVPFGRGVPVSVGASAVVVGVAYYRFVFTRRPALARAVPAADRLQRLFYLTLLLIGAFVLLTLPLLGRSQSL